MAEPRVPQPLRIAGIDGFSIAFQPIVHLISGLAHHFEALLRLPSKSAFGRNVEAFVRGTEALGFVVPMDMDIAKHVALVISGRHYVIPPRVAVNVSGRSLDTPAFRRDLLSRAEQWQDQGVKLGFEVTETYAIQDLAAVRALLVGLRTLGFEVALDDFGKRFTDKAYLRSLVFDMVKIDGSIVRQALTVEGRQLLKKIIAKLRPFGVSIVAEMIDDPRLIEVLRDLHVDYGQGYLFQPPTTDESVLERQGQMLMAM